MDEELRELHGRPGARLKLFFDGALILTEDLAAAAGLDFAGLQIEEDFDFPGGKRVPRQLTASQIAHEPIEAIQHQLPFFQIIVESHRERIGGLEERL